METDITADHVEAVFTTHQRYIEHVARRFLHRPDDVQDVVQTVGVQLCRKLSTFGGRAKLSTWIFAITRNAAMSYNRSQAIRDRVFDGAIPATDGDLWHPVDPNDPERRLIQTEQVRTVLEAIDRLPLEHARVLRMAVNDTPMTINPRRRTKARARLADELRRDIVRT